MYAPVALFCFNRSEHLEITVNSLLQNHGVRGTDIYVFIDGPKSEEDRSEQNKILEFLNSVTTQFKSMSILRSDKNKGLAKSIISGVSFVLEKHSEIIVLEDDMITSPWFLDYMNSALAKYSHIEAVISIHGYFFPVQKGLPETFFLRGSDCWGWATWRRGWDLFRDNGSELADEIEKKQLIKEFNFNDSFDYYQMLIDQINGKNNSWAIRWYASAFLANKLTLYPGQSLVHNIGNDSSGTHCKTTNFYDVNIRRTRITNFSETIEHSKEAFTAVENYLSTSKKQKNKGLISRIWLSLSKKFLKK